MYFIHKDIFRKRLMFFGLIVGVYLFALWNFSSYGNSYAYYKPYYMKSSLTALAYSASGFASKVGAFVLSSIKKENVAESASSPEIAESVPVLLYHGVLNKTDGVNVDLKAFKEQMFALKNAGYKTVSLDDFYLFLQGKKKLPEKSFLLTFDDGRKDSYYPVNPLLKALDFNAVMFAIAKFSEMSKSNYYLTKDEIQRIADNPRWQVESHTRTHRNLTEIPPEEIPGEILGSKQDLENITGEKITAFAFPFGELGQESDDGTELPDESKKEIMNLAKEVYAMSFFQYLTYKRFTQNYPNPLEPNSHYLVKRIEPKPSWSGTELLNLLQAGSAKRLPWSASFSPADGWISTLWGDMTFSQNTLVMKSLDTTTGSAVILDGSYAWKNYQFNAHVVSNSGSNVYLWARYKDDENHVACNFNFSHNLAHVEQTTLGHTGVINGKELKAPADQKDFDLAIRVKDRKVECLLDGKVVAETPYLSPTLLEGGVGLKVWNPIVGAASLVVSDVSIHADIENSSSP